MGFMWGAWTTPNTPPEVENPLWGALAYQIGPGTGYTTSFSSLEGFAAFSPFDPDAVLFLNGRGMLNNDSLLASNVGLGYRIFTLSDLVIGGNVYYDYRDAGGAEFHQIGAGFEILSRFFDFRGNVYAPVSGRQVLTGEALSAGTLQTVGQTITGPPVFQGFNIVFPGTVTRTLTQNRLRVFKAAMTGFDLEAGAVVPATDERLRAYAGFYHLQAPGSQQAWGARGRLEGYVTPNLALNLTVENDRVFDTTVTLGVAVYFPGIRARQAWPTSCLRDRLTEPVVRRPQISVTDEQIFDRVSTTTTTAAVIPAINPATGQPITVEHVNSAAALGGNGTFERPFQSLTQVQTSAVAPADIIFAWANSNFSGQSVILQNNQRFLGEGLAHQFTATQGTFLLPRATAFTALPVIRSAAQDAVTLANNNEVAGFAIQTAGRNGISGLFVAGYNIHDNQIVNSAGSGIFLQDTTGRGLITGNTLSGNALNGIRISNASGALNVTMSNNTLTANGLAGPGPTSVEGNGIAVFSTQGAQVTALINNNTLVGNGAIVAAGRGNNGIYLVPAGDSTMTTTVQNNLISGSGTSGIFLDTSENSHSLVLLLNNQSVGAQLGNGIRLALADNAQTAVGVRMNTLNNNAQVGFLAQPAGTALSQMSLQLLNNISSNGYALLGSSPFLVEGNPTATNVGTPFTQVGVTPVFPGTTGIP
jgi:hypothetical protein